MQSAVSRTVDWWIEEERHKQGALVRVIRQDDPWALMDEEEIEDIKEFIRWYLNKDFAALLQIPVKPRESDIWFSDYEEFRTSAFNTHDFVRNQEPFDRYGYRIKKVLERVKDLAILHSCISSEADKKDIETRYRNLVDDEFRDRLMSLIERYQSSMDIDETMLLKTKIAEQSYRIMNCKEVWQKYSTWD